MKGRDIRTRPADIGLKFRGNHPRMGFDPVEDARQQRLFQTAVAQPSDRGDCDRDQKNHRDG